MMILWFNFINLLCIVRLLENVSYGAYELPGYMPTCQHLSTEKKKKDWKIINKHLEKHRQNVDLT